MKFISFFLAKEKVNSDLCSVGAVEIDDGMRRDIQSALLSMYHDVAKICRKHDIHLFLCGGSALGAVRHKGFIPWDDDIDTAMTREDYEKFKRVFDAELSDKYLFVAPDVGEGSRSRFPKVMKKKTIFRELGNPAPEERCGLFLDLFIIENTPDNLILRKLKGSMSDILEFVGGQVLLVEENDRDMKAVLRNAGRVQYAIRMAVGHCFAYRKAYSWNRIIDRFNQCGNNKSKFCSIPTGRGHFFGEMLPRDVFFPGIEGVFEGESVLLFQHVDQYLKNLYGDYTKIPEMKTRESHFASEIWLGE